MAEKSVSVRLGARVDAYITAMKRAEAATTGFSRGTQRNLRTVGGQMQSVGRALTFGVTLPVAAAGVASTRMAMNFERSFAQMQGLANVPASEIDALKESVLDLSGQTAQAPQELADALYIAASAGLDSADALAVTESAAMASAAGMGETSTVVDLLTTVLGSYGSANISAAEAADILTAAVAEGKAEPAEMAEALGAVLPIAANMGITFEETAASVAFLTNAGLSTDEAVTALRGTMLALMDPTETARQALEDAGTSTEELRAAIAEDGLLGALELLRAHGFDANAEALSNLIEDNRALVGATALLDDASGNLVPIMDAVADSTGRAGEAFAIAADTDAFKMEQAIANLQAAMIEVGEIILPIAADIGQRIADLASFFADLPGPVQAAVVAFAGLAATAGPLIFIVGSLVKNFVEIRKHMAFLGPAAATASKALGLIGIAALAGVAAYNIFTAEQRKTEENTRRASAALQDQFPALMGAAVAAGVAAGEIDGVAIANEALSRSLAEGNTQLAESAAQMNISADELLNVLTTMEADGAGLITTVDNLARSFGFNAEQADFVARNYEAIVLSGGNLTQLFGEQATALGIAEDELVAFTQASQRFFDAADEGTVDTMAREYLNMQVSLGGAAEAAVALAEEQTGLNHAVAGDGVPLFRAYAEVVANATDAEREQMGITEEMAGEIAALDAELAGAATGMESLAEAAMSGSEAFDLLSAAFDFEMFRKIGEFSGLGGGLGDESVRNVQLYSEALHALIDPAREFLRSQDAIWEQAIGFGETIDENSRSLESNTAEGQTNRAALLDWADAILAGADAQIAAGDSITDVNDGLEHNRQALIDAAVAAGFNEQEVEALLDAYGLMPADIETVIKLTGDQIAMKKIEELLLEMDEIDEELVTEVLMIAETEGAWAAYQFLRDTINNTDTEVDVDADVTKAVNAIQYARAVAALGTTIPVVADVSAAVNAINYARGLARIQAALQGFAEGGVGHFGAGTPAMLHGHELIVPLDNPARASHLFGLPEVQAALGKMVPAGAMSPLGGGGGSHQTTQHVTVNMPPGSDGDDVVRALRRWERTRGPIPINTR